MNKQCNISSLRNLERSFILLFTEWDYENLEALREKRGNKFREIEHMSISNEDKKFNFKRIVEDYESSLESHNRKVIDIIYNNFEAFCNGFEQENIKYDRYAQIIDDICNLQPGGNLSKKHIFECCNENIYNFLDAPKE